MSRRCDTSRFTHLQKQRLPTRQGGYTTANFEKNGLSKGYVWADRRANSTYQPLEPDVTTAKSSKTAVSRSVQADITTANRSKTSSPDPVRRMSRPGGQETANFVPKIEPKSHYLRLKSHKLGPRIQPAAPDPFWRILRP